MTKLALILIFTAFSVAVISAHPIKEENGQNSQPHLSENWTLEGLGCDICEEIIKVFGYLWKQPITEQCLAFLANKVCVAAKIEETPVCAMIMHQYANQTIYVLRKLIVNPDLFCPILLGCPSSHNKTVNWTVQIPGNKPPVKPWNLPSEGQPKLRVLHLADLHIDPNYTIGAPANCKEPLCCRKGVTYDGDPVPAGQFGTIGSCDIPLETVENMFQHIKDNEKIDFILWTGDLVPHNVWNVSQFTTNHLLRKLVDMTKQYFPGIDVYSAVGNHEAVPVNMFAPRELTETGEAKGYDIGWLYNELASDWKAVLHDAGTDFENDVKQNAHYSIKRADTNLRIISYNTMYCYDDNFWTWIINKDPDNSLQWLIKQLEIAENNGEFVWLIGHIPNGKCEPWAWTRNFYDVVNRFESTIRGIFTGHTHTDEFQVFYENRDTEKGIATAVTFLGPSVTTFGGNNPAYRIYEVDGIHDASQYVVLNSETYFTNLTEANKSGSLEWKKLYDAKSAYGLTRQTGLTPQDWHATIQNFELHDKYFEKYMLYYSRTGTWKCDSECKKDQICRMKSADSNMIEPCRSAGKGKESVTKSKMSFNVPMNNLVEEIKLGMNDICKI